MAVKKGFTPDKTRMVKKEKCTQFYTIQIITSFLTAQPMGDD
jgi:hypothetical protein